MEAMMIPTISRDLCDQSDFTFPPWKIYDNPFFYNHDVDDDDHSLLLLFHHQQQLEEDQRAASCNNNNIRCHCHCHPSFTFHNSMMIIPNTSDLSSDLSRSSTTTTTTMMRKSKSNKETEHHDNEDDQAEVSSVISLKAELELERKVRKKMERLNKKQAKGLMEERMARESLARQMLAQKEEMAIAKREMEQERRMLKMAELLREERFQMKLAEAKILYQQKLKEIYRCNIALAQGGIVGVDHKDYGSSTSGQPEEQKGETCNDHHHHHVGLRSDKYCPKQTCSTTSSIQGHKMQTISRALPAEPENPHIKRGIKGFVEFPRVVNAINKGGSRRNIATTGGGGGGGSGLIWGNGKIDSCRKPQFRILLKRVSLSPQSTRFV